MGLTRKQKEVFEYIYNYAQDNGIPPTQREIKDHFELKSFGSVQRYIKYLEQSGHLSNDWNARQGIKILKNLDDSDVFGTLSPIIESTTSNIPLLGSIAAGNPIEAIESTTETLEVPNYLVNGKGRYFALNVNGESMIEAGILDGDQVICEYCESAENGQIVVAIHNGDATLKTYYKHDSYIELRPENSSMSPIIIRDGDFRVAGKLQALFRQY